MWLYPLECHTGRKSGEERHPITILFELTLVSDRQISPHKQENKEV